MKEEIEIMTNLDHPNVVKYIESFEDEKYIHIVMEYCKGKDFYDYLVKKGYIYET